MSAVYQSVIGQVRQLKLQYPTFDIKYVVQNGVGNVDCAVVSCYEPISMIVVRAIDSNTFNHGDLDVDVFIAQSSYLN